MNTKNFVKDPNYYKKEQDKIANSLVQMIIDEKSPWRKTWRPDPNQNYFPQNAITNKTYNGMNIFLLWGKSESNKWCTFLGWKKLGYSVIKGEKGSRVHYFEPKKRVKLNDEGKPEKDSNGNDKMITTFLFKTYVLFSSEQVQNKKGESYKVEKVKVDNNIKPIDNCKSFFSHLNANIIGSGDSCFYQPSTDRIGMVDLQHFESAEEYYSVLAHEHIHWTGADHRLKRNKLNYAEEELVAEIGAFLTCVYLGIQSKPKPNNLAYLKHWSQGKINPKKIFSALSDASKSLEYMKDCVEFETKEEVA